MALIVLLGSKYVPLLFLAPLTADFLVREVPLPWHIELGAACVLGLGYAGATTVLSLPRLNFDPSLSSIRALYCLVVVAGISSAVVALAYVALCTFSGFLSWDQFSAAVLHYWIGDAIGILVVTPLLFSLFTAPRMPTQKLEMAAQFSAMAAALWITFAYAHASEFQFFYLLFLPIIWIAVRHGLEGVAASLFVTQIGLILALDWTDRPVGDAAKFQVLMLVLALTGLFLGVAVSEQRRSQNRLRLHQEALARVSRLTSLSTLATTLAHEVNQPLTAIGNYTRLLRDMIKSGEGQTALALETTGKAIAQVDHAARLVRRLKDIVHTGNAEMSPVAPETLVTAALALADPLLESANVAISTRFRDGQRFVLVDRLQIEQVMLNLLTNSIEAIAGSGRTSGKIIIEVGNSAEPRFVDFRIIDNGPGFAPEVVSGTAAPFTTTKPEGTGLGLTLSRSIIERHGGRLILNNEPGGASMQISLPEA